MLDKIILIFLLPAAALAQASCNGYWQYGRDQNQLQGYLTIPHDAYAAEHRLKVILSIGTKLRNSYVGDLALTKDKESAFNDLRSGYSVQYRVRFPIQNPVPRLAAVYYNGKLFCKGEKDPSTATTITLDHVLFSASQKQNLQQNYQQNQYVQQQTPAYQIYQNFQTTPSYQQVHRLGPADYRNNKLAELNAVCGTPFLKLPESTGLVINGKPTKKGQFPWLVAYYHNGERESGFICGGSLVSTKLVITAAHCIHYKYDLPRKVEEALFYIGKYYLSILEDERDFVVSPASRFILHPDWNSYTESFDADIALVILTRTVSFSQSVKPICLWTATNDYRDMINSYGIIAGYGKTSRVDKPSDKPYWAALPVVDEGTCLRSNNDFRKIVSRRTFCVGSRDGRGPCNGDSGGGFVIKYNGKWYLRGLISSSLQDKDLYTCDTKNYAVFTDIAAHRDWIFQYL